jgi:hypothetical protein
MSLAAWYGDNNGGFEETVAAATVGAAPKLPKAI